MPDEPLRPLIERLLASWRQDPSLQTGLLFLLSPQSPEDVEVSQVGDGPLPSEHELNSLFQRAQREQPGFEVRLHQRTGFVYPLRQDEMLQGIWILFPSGQTTDWSAWNRQCQRFSHELFTLRQASLGDPPTFNQLVQAFPAEDAPGGPLGPPALHWERSRSRVDLPLESELSSCLLVDYLPIF